MTALVAKRDIILSQGIQASIKQNSSLELCTSDKDDYYSPQGRLHHLMRDVSQRVPSATPAGGRKGQRLSRGGNGHGRRRERERGGREGATGGKAARARSPYKGSKAPGKPRPGARTKVGAQRSGGGVHRSPSNRK